MKKYLIILVFIFSLISWFLAIKIFAAEFMLDIAPGLIEAKKGNSETTRSMGDVHFYVGQSYDIIFPFELVHASDNFYNENEFYGKIEIRFLTSEIEISSDEEELIYSNEKKAIPPEKSIIWTWTPQKVGMYKFSFIIDSKNQISETSESNIREKSVYVTSDTAPKTDLVITNVEYSKGSLSGTEFYDKNDSIHFKINCKNNAVISAPDSPFVPNFSVSVNAGISANHPNGFSSGMGALISNDNICKVKEDDGDFFFPKGSSVDDTFIFKIDPYDAVEEADENNNSFELRVLINNTNNSPVSVQADKNKILKNDSVFITKNMELFSKLKGKIILTTESKGEAYYVNPTDKKTYYLGRPDDAFKIMREKGTGISNNNLSKIQVGYTGLFGTDSDNDGLTDLFEDAITTNKNKKDSDADGYDDKVEIVNGFNPVGQGKTNVAMDFSRKQIGKIFIQIENKGEAWYVNPSDNKRYFLGRPSDAFSVMRKLGLGISNNNFNLLNGL